MILRLEKDGYKVLSTNARDVSDEYALKVQGKDFYLLTLEMAVDNGFYCTGHIYNPRKKRFDCIDLPVRFLSVKEFAEEFLLGRKVVYAESLLESEKPTVFIEITFTVREELGIPSDVEFQVCL